MHPHGSFREERLRPTVVIYSHAPKKVLQEEQELMPGRTSGPKTGSLLGFIMYEGSTAGVLPRAELPGSQKKAKENGYSRLL